MSTRTLLSLALLACPAASQTVIVPSASATKQPPWFTTNNLGNVGFFVAPETRTQSLFDVTDIASGAATWTSLELRRVVNTMAMPNMVSTATLILGVSPTPSSAISNVFAANLAGANPVTVFAGPLSLSASGPSPAWPAAWEAPIPFTMPFLYIGAFGKSLVVDLLQTGLTTGWIPEAWVPDRFPGTSLGTQPNCRFSSAGPGTGNRTGSIPTPGGTWNAIYTGVPPGLAGFGAIGTQGPGGSWAGLTLPISLAPFGAPGCSWDISIDVSYPLTVSSAFYPPAAVSPTFPVPNLPAIAGQTFHDQAFFRDPAANPWGVVPVAATKWKISGGNAGPGAMVQYTGVNVAAIASGNAAPIVVTMRLR